jgi:hypothetical protein
VPVRSAQLVARRAGLALVDDVLYTCLPDQTVIVKDVVIYNRRGATTDLAYSINPVGAQPVSTLWRQTAMPDKSTTHLDWWHVLEPGDSLVLGSTGSNDALVVLISGAILLGVAEL